MLAHETLMGYYTKKTEFLESLKWNFEFDDIYPFEIIAYLRVLAEIREKEKNQSEG